MLVDTMKLKKWLAIIFGSATTLLLTVGIVFFAVTREAFPKSSGEITLHGPESAVRIVRDSSGVPHIYASTSRDMYFAQGFVHAQDRFWQMEFWRRLGAGRLSELFGAQTLAVDRFIRTMGFSEVSLREYAGMDDASRRVLDAYAAGVNAYISGKEPHELGLQFRLLELQNRAPEIERWKPVHTLTWLKIMAYNLGGNMQTELDTIELARRVGLKQALSFFPAYRYEEMPTITDSAELASAPDLPGQLQVTPPEPNAGGSQRRTIPKDDALPWTTERYLALLPAEPELTDMRTATELIGSASRGGIGSNAWAVSGSMTESGLPLLAADLHLGVQMPSIWYEVHLHAERDEASAPAPFDAAGFSFAGVPGVIIGHNGSIAWGLTNVNPDVQDLYIERIDPNDPYSYQFNGEWRRMHTRLEEISVAGRSEPELLVVRETHRGPIISDSGESSPQSGFTVVPPALPEAGLELTELSLQWTALRPNETFKSVYLMNRAESFEEFREAARFFDVPSQNLVYADVEGNIGYQTPGLIPIRRNGSGRLPVPGWTDRYDWSGYIPFAKLPFVLNPAKGYIATANNAVAPPDYRYTITTEFDHGYRARRIVDLLENGGDSLTRDAMSQMQADTRNISAAELLPYLSELPLHDTDVAGVAVPHQRMERFRSLLLQWDENMARDSAGAAAFAFYFQALVQEALGDELAGKLWSRDRLLGNISRLQSVLATMMHDRTNPWWDDVKTLSNQEQRDEIVLRALARGARIGERHAGESMNSWRWGEVHSITFRSRTFGESELSLVRALFNRGPISVPAGLQQIYSADWDLAEPFGTAHYSSMRQIIDLSDFDRSRMMHPIGQSGHPYHRHYADFAEAWRNVEYHDHRWSDESLSADSTEKLRLKPQK